MITIIIYTTNNDNDDNNDNNNNNNLDNNNNNHIISLTMAPGQQLPGVPRAPAGRRGLRGGAREGESGLQARRTRVPADYNYITVL